MVEPVYQRDGITLYHGKSESVVASLPDNSVDSIVTDPPYELGFMGKSWDSTGIAYNVAFWRECLRVLKPGGHLLAFGGSRTYHRLACAVEDAGFEIRDQIMWVTGQGFPKGHDIAYELHKKAEQASEHDVRFVRTSHLQTPVVACRQCGQVLLASMSKQGASERWRSWSKSKSGGTEQSCVEGWGDLETPQRELQRCPVCSMSHGILADGEKRRVHHGAQAGNGENAVSPSRTQGGGSPHRPQSVEQRAEQPDAVCLERRAQAVRGWNVALKPAHEPIVVARKPLSEGTVAANVLRWGTGGVNVDGCRVGTESVVSRKGLGQNRNMNDDNWKGIGNRPSPTTNIGRFPANLIHDGSEEVLAGFPETSPSKSSMRGVGLTAQAEKVFGQGDPNYNTLRGHDDVGGSAARFFYCAKASRAERNGSKHPTVKPLALMRYLCRLVTPPGGTVLEPFAGSGTTIEAARDEGFACTAIEQDSEYVRDCIARIKKAFADKAEMLPM